jgi:hypothetical protein
MAIDEIKSKHELEDPDFFEGVEDDSSEDTNIENAYDEENMAFEDLNGSDESTEMLEGFQEGVMSDEKPADAWSEDEV